MSVLFDREMIAQVIIILSVCVGGWWVLVNPVAQEVQALESEISQIQLEAQASASGGPVQTAADELLNVNRRFADALKRNEVAKDSSGLYSLIKDLAVDQSVTLHLLQPDGGRADADLGTTTVQVRLLLEGRYEDLARFLDALESYPAFLRVKHLKMETRIAGDSLSIASTVIVEALSFTYGSALDSLAEGVP